MEQQEKPKASKTSKNKQLTVTLIRNIKYRGQRYKSGDTLKISQEDYDVFLEDGVINEE
ncbi:DUF7210 family protein [Bacillus chungangensis]|uniref:DUF7210 domain-containing protein n=1 Tax=Bacillus chungangensis TaxID=587633 RepID=A0ABT9WTB3_9BACI|nr:hypothetical protein [Bacillus chungangensis]MDQ0175995.1 hypothetical protein [Bacillus chungangensis]